MNWESRSLPFAHLCKRLWLFNNNAKAVTVVSTTVFGRRNLSHLTVHISFAKIVDLEIFFLSSLEYSMTISFQIHDRVQELRREIAEIAAADKEKRLSGPEKVKHEQRIQRIEEIRGELSALIWEDRWGQSF